MNENAQLIKNDAVDNGVSVIIPVYNSSKTLRGCLDSVVNQTISNLQIICVNDGSTDDSLQILLEYAKSDDRFEIIDQANSGVSAARNAGLNAVTKDYIVFLDSDDKVEPNAYNELLNTMLEFNCDCVCCGYKEYWTSGHNIELPVSDKTKFLSNKNDVEEIIIKPMLGFSKSSVAGYENIFTKIFKASIIKDNLICFNEKRGHGEDWQFCVQYLYYCNSVVLLDSLLYCYIHSNSESQVTRFRENILEMIFEDRERYLKLFPDYDWQSEKKVNSYLNAPFTAAHHYFSHLKGNALKKKLHDAVDICMNNSMWCKYAYEKGGKWCSYVRFPKKLYFHMYIKERFLNIKRTFRSLPHKVARLFRKK